ncbi:MAG: AI-2E family transporter [Candidatus Eremiobacteraeota bacterium]|nr:AI-2E family transporter [Candidatus Eremiobacteraeota bacterium]
MQQKPKVYQWFTEERVTYWLKVLLLVVVAAYVLGGILDFLARIESITIIIILAIFVAYVLYPAVRFFNARLPLIAAILIVYLCLFLVMAVLLSVVLPAITNEVTQIVKSYPHFVNIIQNNMMNPHEAWLARIPDWMRASIASMPVDLSNWFKTHRYDATLSALSMLAGTLTVLATLVIVPVLSAYILLDSEDLKRYFVALIPQKRRENSLGILTELDEVIGGFIRGQLLVGATVGILITGMLLALHVPYAFIIGFAAAILDIIPYVGAVVTFIPAVILAFVTGGAAHSAIVAVLFILIFEVEGHFIAPVLVSKTVSLSPLTVILAILIGGDMMGIVGMFIAIPVAGMLRVLVAHIMPQKVSLEEAQPALTEAPREETELAVGEASS